jgi:5-deoxy-glucuronate isomerase
MSTATAEQSLTLESCVVRDTASRKGRTRTVSPGKTSAKHLHYGRIILDAGDASLSIETGGHETGFIVLGGSASIVAGGKTFEMGRYDALYTPRDGVVEVRPGSGGCDIAEISAPVDHAYPLQFVRFAEVQKDPGLHFKAGGASAERTLNVLFGKNIQAGRIMAGVTFSAPGNWTSWPPHEHAALAEEAYLYIDMPAPSFGLQMVYTDKTTPELAVVGERGRRRSDAQGVSPERRRSGRLDQLPVDDGREPRNRGPSLRCRERAPRLQANRLRPRRRGKRSEYDHHHQSRAPGLELGDDPKRDHRRGRGAPDDLRRHLDDLPADLRAGDGHHRPRPHP